MFSTIFGVLGPLLGPALERLFPDPAARQNFLMELYTKLQASDLAQLEVNKAEAASGSWFASGWRPAVGWICAAAFGLQYVLLPITIAFFAFLAGIGVPHLEQAYTTLLNAKQLLNLDEVVMELLIGMLGMASIRSFDKFKGIAGK